MAHKRKPLIRTKADMRNNSLLDWWSLIHFATGVGLGWVMRPALALTLMILWEPLEILVLSPLLAKCGIDFGYETWRNALSDILIDGSGIFVGYFLFLSFLNPPFQVF